MSTGASAIRRSPHRILWRRYRHYAALQEFRVSVCSSIAIFLASIVASFYAIQYATKYASNPVTDIILSNTPTLDMDGFFIYGTAALVACTVLILFSHPKRIPFTLHALALFYFVRSGFVMLTHIGPFPAAPVDADWGSIAHFFLASSDLFFSGHVGFSFMMALIFWRERAIRYVFLGWSVYMTFVVLLGHYHYSIDVASAFFISYTIYCFAEWLFPGDRALFYSDMPIDMV